MHQEIFQIVLAVVSTIVGGMFSVILWLFKKALTDIASIKLTLATLEGKISVTDFIQKRVEKHDEKIILVDAATQSAHKRIDNLIVRSKHGNG